MGSYTPGRCIRGVVKEKKIVVDAPTWLRGEGTLLTVLLHDGEDFDDDLGRRSDQDLSLSSSFSVDDVVLFMSVLLTTIHLLHVQGHR